MSKKSTARTGSEGDADSTFTGVFANIRSGSSSCNSKRELGGPFGDSLCENNQHTCKDCFILMFQDDDTTETSDSSDEDQELYNLKNDYLEKLNALRKRLNLIEISDDFSSSSPSSYNNRCTITEIVDEETSSGKSSKIDKEPNSSNEPKTSTSEENRSKTDKPDLIAVYPSPISFKFDSFSTAIFEPDYNPPKKKVCCRQKTPRHNSLSEGNLPYYTRIGLHDDLFSSSKNLHKGRDLKGVNQFIETKATQYTEDDFDFPEVKQEREVSKFKELDNVNLFPKVIIENKTENVDSNSSTSPASKPVSSCSRISITEQEDITAALSLNIIEENSDDSFTTTTYSTTIDSPDTKKNVKKRFGRKNKVSSSEKLTMWEEIRRLHSSRGSDGDKAGHTTEELNVIEVLDRNLNRKKPRWGYIKQYIAYRKQKRYIKPRYIPFGTKVVERHQKVEGSTEKLSHRESSSASNGDEKVVDEEEKKDGGDSPTFWKRFCFCWPSLRE